VDEVVSKDNREKNVVDWKGERCVEKQNRFKCKSSAEERKEPEQIDAGKRGEKDKLFDIG
jgi:hypothetical protein